IAVIRIVVTPELVARPCPTSDPPSCGFAALFYGRYWARTSYPGLSIWSSCSRSFGQVRLMLMVDGSARADRTSERTRANGTPSQSVCNGAHTAVTALRDGVVPLCPRQLTVCDGACL